MQISRVWLAVASLSFSVNTDNSITYDATSPHSQYYKLPYFDVLHVLLKLRSFLHGQRHCLCRGVFL